MTGCKGSYLLEYLNQANMVSQYSFNCQFFSVFDNCFSCLLRFLIINFLFFFLFFIIFCILIILIIIIIYASLTFNTRSAALNKIVTLTVCRYIHISSIKPCLHMYSLYLYTYTDPHPVRLRINQPQYYLWNCFHISTVYTTSVLIAT